MRKHPKSKNPTSSKLRGRRPKNPPQYEDKDGEDILSLYAQINDHEEAECVPNGIKAIECFICNKQMNRIYKLRQHMKLHAEAKSYDDKNLESSTIYSILNPSARNIETKVIRDFIVEEVSQKRYSQFYGILTEAEIELNISDSESDSDDGDNRGENKLIPQNIYKCDLCQITFDRRYKALFHQKTSHSSKKLNIECDYCGRQFIGVQLFIHHLKTQCESDEHPISCVERFRQYLLQINLEQFECLAQARKELKIHRITTAEKLYACPVCQKTFVRSEHLTRHKAVHLPDELKMECPVCYKKFNRKDNLRTHMKVHMGEAERDASNDQPILCQYCGHCFTSKSNYVVHMRRHTGEKPYNCDVCGKGFPKSTDLNSHKITHTGERNFSCNICQKTFRRSAVLSKHKRVHSGPYRCTYCDQSFRRPNELASHLRMHASGKALSCCECNDKFSTKEQLEQHCKISGHNGNCTAETSNEARKEGNKPSIGPDVAEEVQPVTATAAPSLNAIYGIQGSEPIIESKRSPSYLQTAEPLQQQTQQPPYPNWQ